MQFTSAKRLDDGVVEREFTLGGEIPGILWTPAAAAAPAPLILLGHPGGLRRMHPRLAARARQSVAEGFAAATIELPGSGDRPRSAAAEEARADLRRALAAGDPVDDDLVDRLVLPLVDTAVPEWQGALDALLPLPQIGGAGRGAGGGLSPRLPPGAGGAPPPCCPCPRSAGRPGTRAGSSPSASGWPWSSRASRPSCCSPGASCPAPCSRTPGGSPSRCRSCCSGTTRGTTGRWLWTCSTPSAPGRRPCTPTWAATPASRRSRGTPATGSSSGTCGRSGRSPSWRPTASAVVPISGGSSGSGRRPG